MATKRILIVIFCIIGLYVMTLVCLSQAVGDGDQPHTKFVETDEVIITLGYKLYPDGMPTRILRDRVEKAAGLYHQLVRSKHHPLFIVSGKGKTDSGYTEAQVMKEFAEYMGVQSDDILIDHDSTNTVQNAMFSASLIQNKRINEAFMVTSDYHMLRAQYIFQTVFPSNISLGFVSSETSEDKRLKEKPVEKLHMKTGQDDLIALKLLDSSESYGYHPLRNLPRWQMIEREINDDFRPLPHNAGGAKSPIRGKGVILVDYGSNYGYFSLQFARKFPDAVVVSLEGEAWKEYDGAADFHVEKMKEFDIDNNYLCRTLVTPSTFKKLHLAGQLYNYQLSLSVFHWFTPMNTREVFEESLSYHLLNARTTFIELPEAMNYTGNEGQHMWKRMSVWYAGRDEEQVIADVARKNNFDVRIKTLGAILHDTGTVRKVIRVDVLDNKQSVWELKKLLSIYSCKEVVGGNKN